VDAALALARDASFVSAGGDIAVRSATQVALPGGGSVSLERGSLATSGTATRSWRRGGALQHHVIDPRTGRPAISPWTQVTACGIDCVAADVCAKAGFLLGTEGPDWLDGRGVPGRFVDVTGEVLVNEAWRVSAGAERLACI
jgi:thiamine biosynthesis lipoprotein